MEKINIKEVRIQLNSKPNQCIWNKAQKLAELFMITASKTFIIKSTGLTQML